MTDALHPAQFAPRDVLPRGGTLVLFDSVTLPHEVLATVGRERFAASGWFHEVENLTDCISINHNWLNAHNVKWALTKLLTVLKCIKAGLDAEDGTDGELCEDLLDRARQGQEAGRNDPERERDLRIQRGRVVN